MTLFLDAETAAQRWTRGHPLLVGLHGRVYFGVPENTDGTTPTLPLLTVARLGGAPDAGEVPFDYARITFEVWAQRKSEAVSLTGGLVEALHQMRYSKVGLVALRGAVVDSIVWAPDVESKLARYIVDATITVAPA